MRIRTLQGTWDKKQGRGKYIGDQSYLELEITQPLDTLKLEDFRIPHLDQEGVYDFWGHQYAFDVISFNHHNAQNLDNCDHKPVGHKDHNGCGYAGAVFEYTVEGITYKIKGAWSSNESHFYDITGNLYTHCAIYEVGRLTGWGGLSIRVRQLIDFINEQELPYKLVQGLGSDLSTIEFVHNDDVEKFIAQAGMWNPESYSRTGTRWASQYSDIEGPSKYRTRYIKDDIANAKILNP